MRDAEVIAELAKLIQEIPNRGDNGPDFLGEAFVQWLKINGVAIQYIQPGAPNRNACVE